MNKSIRTLALSAAIFFTAAPMFANIMGTDPHPQVASASLSVSDYAGILLNLIGL
jgi:hypothetical protein